MTPHLKDNGQIIISIYLQVDHTVQHESENSQLHRYETPTVNLVSWRQEADVWERNLPSVSIIKLDHHSYLLPFIR